MSGKKITAIEAMDKCKRGHELTEDNVYTDPKGRTFCRTCRRENVAKHRALKKEGKTPSSREVDFCRNGHRRTETNTYIDSEGHRHCKVCWRLGARTRYREAHGLPPNSEHDFRRLDPYKGKRRRKHG